MRIMRALVSVLLVCILCGCSSQANYLKEGERKKIEETLLNSFELQVEEYRITASFHNGSNYTLHDVKFVSTETNNVLLSILRLDSGMSGNLRVYGQEIEELDSDDTVYLEYTVGEYTYCSDAEVAVRKTTAEKTLDTTAAPKVSVATKNGMMELDYDSPLEFSTGTEVSGLKKYKIYSIIPEVPYEGGLEILLTGSKPDKYYGTLIAKLWNEDGDVINSSSVYFSDNNATIYVFNSKPENYSLTFEEIE